MQSPVIGDYVHHSNYRIFGDVIDVEERRGGIALRIRQRVGDTIAERVIPAEGTSVQWSRTRQSYLQEDHVSVIEGHRLYGVQGPVKSHSEVDGNTIYQVEFCDHIFDVHHDHVRYDTSR